VRIISRDRDGVYAEGGRAGAPSAKQVADRFHLMQNVSKAVQDELARRRDHLLIPAQEFVRNTAAEDGPAPEPENVQQSEPAADLRQNDIGQQRCSSRCNCLRW
jgi:transposase